MTLELHKKMMRIINSPTKAGVKDTAIYSQSGFMEALWALRMEKVEAGFEAFHSKIHTKKKISIWFSWLHINSGMQARRYVKIFMKEWKLFSAAIPSCSTRTPLWRAPLFCDLQHERRTTTALITQHGAHTHTCTGVKKVRLMRTKTHPSIQLCQESLTIDEPYRYYRCLHCKTCNRCDNEEQT